MAHYRVILNGKNFLLEVDDNPARMGFYTTRWVEAETEEAAEYAAVDLLRTEGKLKPLNEQSDPPMVFLHLIEEVDPADVPDVVGGFTFYAEEDDGDE